MDQIILLGYKFNRKIDDETFDELAHQGFRIIETDTATYIGEEIFDVEGMRESMRLPDLITIADLISTGHQKRFSELHNWLVDQPQTMKLWRIKL